MSDKEKIHYLERDIENLKKTIKDREREIYRIRTTEIQASCELDTQQTPEQRATFQQTCNRMIELEQMLTICRLAISKLPEDSLGFGKIQERRWPLRDELIHEIDKLLGRRHY